MVMSYKERKGEVLASYNMLEALISELHSYAQASGKKVGLSDSTEQVKELLSNIRIKAKKVKADQFSIIVAGEAKSGKSTFINAYLGLELLPMDVNQCTSAIVEIKYGKECLLRATYADGRIKEISGEETIRDFLKNNAALNDEYRSIPVPTINYEIIVKSGLRSRDKGHDIVIHEDEVNDMLNALEVKNANIHNLQDYNDRIKKYINEKKASWKDIVTKIEVMFPFSDDLKGIEIIDSPGVCAYGGVAEVTNKYIKNANAIIFLKPVTGQSLESTSFNQFMKNASVERNKNALFLVFTHIATKNDADMRRLEEEAYKQFEKKLNTKNILFVDSKAELYAKKFAGIKNIKSELSRLNSEETLDDFVVKAYVDTQGILGNDNGDIKDFIKKLEERSRFSQVYCSLETFGRKAHYLLLCDLLKSIYDLYNKLWNNLNYNIETLRTKAEDPSKLAKKIADTKAELDIINKKMVGGVDDVVKQFNGDEGLIRTKANEAVNDFLELVGKIVPDADDAFDQLEKLSLKKIDDFKILQEELQKQVIEDFDKNLVELSDKSAIPFELLKPDFTEETFEKIKDATKEHAEEAQDFEEGLTFKKVHTRYYYSRNKHFKIINEDIQKRLEALKNNLVDYLGNFVENIRTKYIKELSKNADTKKKELNAIYEAKATAEQIKKIIEDMEAQNEKISSVKADIEKLKGGIDEYVQQNN